MALKYLGFNPDKMRIVAVKDMNLRVGHAILAVYVEDKIFILDNQIKVVVDSRRIHHYKPVYSINEKYWWRHRAAKS
jgi:predicted transglutaminase-like cysteine proteinase